MTGSPGSDGELYVTGSPGSDGELYVTGSPGSDDGLYVTGSPTGRSDSRPCGMVTSVNRPHPWMVSNEY